MEPENLLPKVGLERGNVQYERAVDKGASKEAIVDGGIEKGAEQKERVSEAAAAIADSSFPTTLPTPVPLVSDASTSSDDQSSQTTANPLTANDDDLIEKEWVDKAKKIIVETKEDPYSREKAVNQLQKDYQQKRYGRGLGGA